MKIDKLPSGSYRCRVYVNTDYDGKKHYKSFTAPTQKELRLMVAKFQSEKDVSVKEDITLGDVMKRQVDIAKLTKAHNTYLTYQMYTQTKYKWLQKVKINKINMEMIQRAILDEYENGTNITTLRSAASFVIKCLQSVDVNINTKKLQFPKATESKEYPTPTPEELNKIFEFLKEEDYEVYLMTKLAAMCSLRLGEVVGLIPSDYKDGYLHIQRSRDITVHSTKTKSSNRFVPVPKELRSIFENASGDNYIFPYLERSYIVRIKKLMKKYGNPKITFHTFRHAFASNMVASGVPIKYIMDMGGWSSPTMINKIYAQTFNNEKENALYKLEEYMKTK